MLRRSLVTAGAVISFLSFAPAALADSYSASASPTTAGSASQPAPEKVTTDLQISTDVTGTPKNAVESYASLMPSEFMDDTSRFGTCPRSTVYAAAVGGEHAPPNCPANSVLATGVLAAVIPSLALSVTSDKVYIYNDGSGQITGWFHFNSPAYTGAVNAAITQGSTPFGPVVTWDFSPYANGAYNGVLVYVKDFQATWTPQGEVTPAAGAGGNTSSGSSPTHANARAACISKAKKRYKHNKRRRAKAIRACEKRYTHKRRPKSKARGAATAQQAGGQQVAPFASTGCANGSWKFEAHVKFKSSPDETLDQSISCSGPGGTTPPVTPPPPGGGGTCGLPICLPSSALQRLLVAH